MNAKYLSQLLSMDRQDHFNILREIKKKPTSSQRQLAKSLGFSLGKLNYCIKALQNKGLVKIQNFKKQKIRLNISDTS